MRPAVGPARRLLAALHAIGCAFLLTTTSVADAQTTVGESAEYRELVEEAVAEYQGQRFLEARALFTRAHALYPNARTQRGIGICAFELREYPQARRALLSALATTERPLTDAQRAEVEELLVRTARFLGIVRVELGASTDASVDVSVDGVASSAESDGAHILTIGRHTVLVSASGHAPLERVLEIVGGETITLTPTVIEAAVTPPSQPQVVAATTDAPSDEPIAAYALLGGGGALALAAIGVGAFAWPSRDLELGRCEAAGIACDNADALRSERDATIGVTIGLGVAAAALVTVGVVLLLEERPTEDASVACGVGLLGASCRGRF